MMLGIRLNVFMQLSILNWSNWKKVQLNTDLLKLRHVYLYRRMMVWLKLNEFRSVINMGGFLIKGSFWKGGRGSLHWDIFTTDKESLKFLQKILMKSPNCHHFWALLFLKDVIFNVIMVCAAKLNGDLLDVVTLSETAFG